MSQDMTITRFAKIFASHSLQLATLLTRKYA